MRVLNGRDDVPPGKIPGLARIAVLGDSMTYGQGVSPVETLPYFFEQQLNDLMLGPLFQVVNCGVSGFNLWNSLSTLRNIPQFYDAVVLILCVNDADVFGRTFQVGYNPNSETWEPGTPSFQLAKAQLEDTKKWLAERDVPLMLGYYTIWDIDYEARITEILSDLCRELNIPFADFFGYFHERRLRQGDLRVSKFDFHPSPVAHGAAARYLTQLFQRHRWTERFKSPRSPAALPRDIVAIAQAMDREGAREDTVLRWASDALAAKTRAVTRLPKLEDRREFASELDGSVKLVNASYAEWRSNARIQALSYSLFARDHPFPSRVWLIDEGILRTEELLMVAKLPDKSTVSTLSSRLSIPSDMPKPPDFDLQHARAEIDAGQQKMARLRSQIDRMNDDHGSASMLSLRAARRDALTSLIYLTDIAPLLSRQTATWERRVAEVEEIGNPNSEEIAKLIGQARHCLADAAQHLAGAYSHYDYILEEPLAKPQFFTSVDVYVKMFELSGQKPLMLDVFVDSLAPRRMVMKDGMYVGFEGGTILLPMRFPIFFFARPTIVMNTPDPELRGKRASLLKVEIYNDPAKRVTLTPNDFYRTAAGDVVFPFVLVP